MTEKVTISAEEFESQQLQLLIDGMFDGELNDASRAYLNQYILEDEQALDMYCSRIDMHLDQCVNGPWG